MKFSVLKFYLLISICLFQCLFSKLSLASDAGVPLLNNHSMEDYLPVTMLGENTVYIDNGVYVPLERDLSFHVNAKQDTTRVRRDDNWLDDTYRNSLRFGVGFDFGF